MLRKSGRILFVATVARRWKVGLRFVHTLASVATFDLIPVYPGEELPTMKLFRRYAFIFLGLLLISSVSPDAVEAIKQKDVKFGKWQYLFRVSSKVVGTKPLPQKSSIQSLKDFTITGVFEKDINRLNRVICDGEWGTSQGVLTQISGRAAAIKLGHEKDFELEAGIDARGTGGWFLIFGYDEGHGYGIYNVTLKTSGSPWFLTEFRDQKGVTGSDREIGRYESRGKESLKLRVIENKVSITIGNRQLLEDVELTSLHEGDIILGTYDTQYGPKPVKIYGLRLRTTK